MARSGYEILAHGGRIELFRTSFSADLHYLNVTEPGQPRDLLVTVNCRFCGRTGSAVAVLELRIARFCRARPFETSSLASRTLVIVLCRVKSIFDTGEGRSAEPGIASGTSGFNAPSSSSLSLPTEDSFRTWAFPLRTYSSASNKRNDRYRNNDRRARAPQNFRESRQFLRMSRKSTYPWYVWT